MIALWRKGINGLNWKIEVAAIVASYPRMSRCLQAICISIAPNVFGPCLMRQWRWIRTTQDAWSAMRLSQRLALALAFRIRHHGRTSLKGSPKGYLQRVHQSDIDNPSMTRWNGSIGMTKFFPLPRPPRCFESHLLYSITLRSHIP